MPDIDSLLREGADAIGGERDAFRQAQLLLGRVLGCAPDKLPHGAEQAVSSEQRNAYRALLARRCAGEPLAYILGECGFWSLKLQASPAALIPRPESERLVEVALELFPQPHLTAADLGTGSGAIALALASERPGWSVIGTDRHRDALDLARTNAAIAALPNAPRWLQGDWCGPLADGACDLIVANPPYVAADDPHLEALRCEPRHALVAAEQGLADLHAIIAQAQRCLRPGGTLLLEHGFTQGEAVRRAMQQANWQQPHTWCDLLGHERVTGGRAPA